MEKGYVENNVIMQLFNPEEKGKMNFFQLG
jgi:hypothetical protein